MAAAVVALLSVWLCACSPALDWREQLAEGSGLVTTFPCHPDRHARQVDVAGRRVEMQMLVCTAAGATYAVSFYDAPEATQVGGGLVALRAALVGNVRDDHPRLRAAAVRGMTPNPAALRLDAEGRRPDGAAFALRAAVFAHGLRVYQAAVVASVLTDDAVDPFFSGLRFPD